MKRVHAMALLLFLAAAGMLGLGCYQTEKTTVVSEDYDPDAYEHHLDQVTRDGTVEINSTPAEAQVFLVTATGAEIFQGRTPLVLPIEANGIPVPYVVRKPGYLARRFDATARSDQPKVIINLTLPRDRNAIEGSVTGPRLGELGNE